MSAQVSDLEFPWQQQAILRNSPPWFCEGKANTRQKKKKTDKANWIKKKKKWAEFQLKSLIISGKLLDDVDARRPPSFTGCRE